MLVHGGWRDGNQEFDYVPMSIRATQVVLVVFYFLLFFVFFFLFVVVVFGRRDPQSERLDLGRMRSKCDWGVSDEILKSILKCSFKELVINSLFFLCYQCSYINFLLLMLALSTYLPFKTQTSISL